jgi:hypothetical protein
MCVFLSQKYAYYHEITSPEGNQIKNPGFFVKPGLLKIYYSAQQKCDEKQVLITF